MGHLGVPFLDALPKFQRTVLGSLQILTMPPPAEGSEAVAARFAKARSIQRQRYAVLEARTNTAIRPPCHQRSAPAGWPFRSDSPSIWRDRATFCCGA
jgi:predicted ATPase with chaperone activity